MQPLRFAKKRRTLLHTAGASVLIGLMLLVLNGCSRTSEETIAIVAWGAPPAQEVDQGFFSGLAECGFNVAVVDYEHSEMTRKTLELAEEQGLRLFIGDPRIKETRDRNDTTLAPIDSVAADFSSYTALYGYLLTQELGGESLDRIAEMKKRLKQRDPLHVCYVNLHPSYASLSDLGADSYHEYLHLYADKATPELLSFSFDAFYEEMPRPDYYSNLEQMREVSIRSSVPFWGFVYPKTTGPYSRPHESYWRFQVMSLLAYGARGVQYYPYWPQPGSSEETSSTLVNDEGNKTDIYYMAQRINRGIAQWTPVLKWLRSIGVYHSDPVPEGCRDLGENLPIYRIVGQNVFVGVFEHSRNHECYFMIANRSYLRGAKPTLFFEDYVKKIEEVPKKRDSRMVVEFDSRDQEKSAAILLKAGDARLFRIFQ